MELLEKNGFWYILRVQENMNVVLNGKNTNLRLLPGKTTYLQVYATAWKRDIKVVKRVKNTHHWLLITNLPNPTIQEVKTQYSARFSIEKMFKNQKKLFPVKQNYFGLFALMRSLLRTFLKKGLRFIWRLLALE